jgi:IS5 family transposase
MEEAHAFANGIRERYLRYQLLLGGKGILREDLNHAVKLEAANIAAGMPWTCHHPPTTPTSKKQREGIANHQKTTGCRYKTVTPAYLYTLRTPTMHYHNRKG